MKPMSEPPYPHLGDTTNSRSVVDRMSDFIHKFRANPIEHTGEDRIARLTCDSQNGKGAENTEKSRLTSMKLDKSVG